jgi:hypothetical protein
VGRAQLACVRKLLVKYVRTSLIPLDPRVVISKLDIKLRTPTPTDPPSTDANL